MARVLLVEDDPWMADCYRTWLAADSHEVTHVRDAQAALNAADTQVPDVVMLDLLLPYSSGVQVLHAMQSYTDLARVPVILCSSSLPADVPPLEPYGVVAVLDKAALSPHQLRQTIKKAVRHAAV